MAQILFRVYVESNIHYWVISFLWNLVNHPNYPFDPDKKGVPKLLDLWIKNKNNETDD